jgi:hypothetical protein
VTIKSEDEENQRKFCEQHGTAWYPAPANLKVGVSRNLKSTIVPVNGLRHPPAGDTTGWYLWAGEGGPPSDPEFFVPLHVAHLSTWRPEVLKFLGLPPGWRFLTDGTYEDVWHDSALVGV